MTKPAKRVLGAREPRYRSVPPAPTSAGPEAIDLAASAGLFLDPWQQDVLIGALGERPDGHWAASRVGLIVPRQNGKNAILEARELAGLYLFGEVLITHTAHRVDTSLEHFARMRALIEETPHLAAELDDVVDTNGKEGLVLRGGRRLNFKARSKGSGRGFTGDCVVLDEAYYLYDLGGLIPTMSARPNPQLWYTSSAPLARAESDRLRNLCTRGRAAARAQLEAA